MFHGYLGSSMLRMIFIFFIGWMGSPFFTMAQFGGAVSWSQSQTCSQCPSEYVCVPPKAPYTYKAFCVAKYEMKSSISSTSIGNPVVSIPKDTASTNCTGLPGGRYELITNNQWQTIGYSIVNNPKNWSNGAIFGGGDINTGHVRDSLVGINNMGIDAPLSGDNPCYNKAGHTCTENSWHQNKRTHKLANGEIIWDFSGNVWEWVNHTNSYSSQTGTIVSLSGALRDIFGTVVSGTCWGGLCGFGYLVLQTDTSAPLARGGNWSSGDDAGVFAARRSDTWDSTVGSPDVGYRCTYNPN